MPQKFAFAFVLTFITLTVPLLGLAQNDDNRPLRFDILHYDVHLDFTDVNARSLKSACSVNCVVLHDTVTAIYLDLLRQSVDSVKDVRGGMLNFSYNDTILRVDLPADIDKGDTFAMRVFHGGTPYVESQWGGWYFQGNYIFNLGVGFQTIPHNLGRVWHPCVDNFTERATYDVRIAVRKPLVAVGSGVLVSQAMLGGDTMLYHWRLEQTIPAYLYGISISDYTVHRDSLQGMERKIPTDLFVRRPDSAKAAASFRNLPNALQTLESRFGPYRWPRIGYSMTTRGAMEHAMNVSFPYQNIDGSLAEESRIAHELAHHWWGNLVTCASAEEMWINEGMAVFCEYLYLRDLYGWERARAVMQDNLYDVVKNAHLKEGGYQALSAVPQEYTYGIHSYKKGSLVAWNLMQYLGDSMFFEGMAYVLERHKFGSLTSAEIAVAMSYHLHGSLKPPGDIFSFINDWVHQGGLPVFDIGAYNYDSLTGELTGFIQQTKGGNKYHILDITLPMTAYAADGRIFTFPVRMRGERGNYSATLPFVPVYVALNTDRMVNYAHTVAESKIYQKGGINTTHTAVNVNVVELTDSAFLRLEAFWGSPYISAANMARIRARPNPRRYWRLDGVTNGNVKHDFSTLFDASAADQPDFGLLQTSEDSLIVLYRRYPWQEWERMDTANYVINYGAPNDNRGSFTLQAAPLGEFVLAEIDHTIIDGYKDQSTPISDAYLYPNPTHRRISSTDSGVLKLFTLAGCEVFSQYVDAHISIDIENLPPACFIWTLETSVGVARGKLIIR